MSGMDDSEAAAQLAGSLLFSVDARFVKLDRIGRVPEGERTNAHYLGDASGMLGPGKMRGIDYSLTRPDGVVAIHVYEVFTSEENYLIALERRGVGVPAGEAEISISGTGWARTAQEGQAWLNDTPLMWRGIVNRQTGQLRLKIFAVRSEEG